MRLPSPLLLLLVLAMLSPACRLAMDIPDGPDVPCDGDGVRDEGETCDGTDLGGFTCERLGYHGGTLACTPGCLWDAADCQATGFCGDGALQTGAEACEGTDLGGASCESLGFSGGFLACGDDCAFDTSDCQAICNSDGVKDQWEICDRNDLGGASCASLGYHGGALACTSACTFNLEDCIASGRCGDGVLDEGHEDCEPDNVMVTSCETLGLHPGTLVCGADCRFDTTGCDGRCGDGIVQIAYEQCDGTNLAGAACESLGFYPGILQCTSACTYNTTGCTGFCGDGVIQAAHEVCEPGHPNSETCRGLGHFDGELCGTDCAYDEGRCIDVVHLTAGSQFTCAVLSDGTARCWGVNTVGQLALGTAGPGPTTTPQPTLAFPGLGVISAGGNHACALTSGGSLSCWGLNASGQMGQGHILTPQVTPVTVPGLGTVSAVSAGQNFTCALLSDQTVKCWGANNEGQLGIGSRVDQSSPQTTSLVPGVIAVEAGREHACAIVNPGGALLCWGTNGNGQIGDDSTNDRLSPVAVSGLGSVFAVSAGGTHTCAIDTGGVTWCWGGNGSGQVGDGTTWLRAPFPTQPDWTQTAVALATGERHTCAITVAGNVWCWGECGNGQCGSGGTSDRMRPNQVSGITGAAGITAGDNHTCVRLSTGALRCWGANSYGQLGDGTTVQRNSPVEVLP
jgi:alpha-tubulin suppressor-like RCC1 family protein